MTNAHPTQEVPVAQHNYRKTRGLVVEQSARIKAQEWESRGVLETVSIPKQWGGGGQAEAIRLESGVSSRASHAAHDIFSYMYHCSHMLLSAVLGGGLSSG